MTIFRHKIVGYMQLFICSLCLLYGIYCGIRYNNFLNNFDYLNLDQCKNNPEFYSYINIKGIRRCVDRDMAAEWREIKASMEVSLAIFLVVLLVPSILSGKLKFDGWNKGFR